MLWPLGGGLPTYLNAVRMARVGPIPVVRANTIDRLKSTHSGRSVPSIAMPAHAPHLPFALRVGIGSVGWIPVLRTKRGAPYPEPRQRFNLEQAHAGKAFRPDFGEHLFTDSSSGVVPEPTDLLPLACVGQLA